MPIINNMHLISVQSWTCLCREGRRARLKIHLFDYLDQCPKCLDIHVLKKQVHCAFQYLHQKHIDKGRTINYTAH